MSEAESIGPDSLVEWITEDGRIVMSVNDTKRGAAFINAITPALEPTNRRRKWSSSLTEAAEWLELARKYCRRRDHSGSRDAAMCAVRALENAMLYAEPK